MDHPSHRIAQLDYYFDKGGQTSSESIATRLYRVDAVPTTVIIGPDGIMAAVTRGFADDASAGFIATLTKLGVKVLRLSNARVPADT